MAKVGTSGATTLWTLRTYVVANGSSPAFLYAAMSFVFTFVRPKAAFV